MLYVCCWLLCCWVKLADRTASNSKGEPGRRADRPGELLSACQVLSVWLIELRQAARWAAQCLPGQAFDSSSCVEQPGQSNDAIPKLASWVSPRREFRYRFLVVHRLCCVLRWLLHFHNDPHCKTKWQSRHNRHPLPTTEKAHEDDARPRWEQQRPLIGSINRFSVRSFRFGGSRRERNKLVRNNSDDDKN